MQPRHPPDDDRRPGPRDIKDQQGASDGEYQGSQPSIPAPTDEQDGCYKQRGQAAEPTSQRAAMENGPDNKRGRPCSLLRSPATDPVVTESFQAWQGLPILLATGCLLAGDDVVNMTNGKALYLHVPPPSI